VKTRVEELFYQVADLSPGERRRYFDEHAVDISIQREVEILLSCDRGTDTYLARDISEAAARTVESFRATGLACGVYRLGQILGRGGMGAVYLAERTDGEAKQRVAVKLLHPSCSNGVLRERFLAERQILATLSHPNIARLLDVGHRPDGQPYLVLEYIQGQHIDAYSSALALRQRITLFRRVCSAVSYLHRKRVVHLDLKPANILVTEDGEPKLLDFGIAELLDKDMASRAMELPLFTPAYASPEQVVGGQITTAMDIYSLGAILYRLLVGRSPHETGAGRSRSEVASVAAAGDIVRPSQITPALKGDLEAILLKALRREPQERYASVEQLAEDLKRFLARRPVQACRGDTPYRARRLLRRHWLSAPAAGPRCRRHLGGCALWRSRAQAGEITCYGNATIVEADTSREPRPEIGQHPIYK